MFFEIQKKGANLSPPAVCSRKVGAQWPQVIVSGAKAEDTLLSFRTATMAAQLSAQELAVYDRQIRMWGMEAQKRMRNAAVCVLGLDGLAAEVAKNIMLAGIGRLHIIDDCVVSDCDVGSNFLLPEETIGTPVRFFN